MQITLHIKKYNEIYRLVFIKIKKPQMMHMFRSFGVLLLLFGFRLYQYLIVLEWLGYLTLVSPTPLLTGPSVDQL